MKRKVVLAIINGWGIEDNDKEENAIKQANAECLTYLAKKHPSFLLRTMGEYVGLRKGHTGDSTQGHKTVGTGRSCPSDKTIIDREIFNMTLKNHLNIINNNGYKRCHVIALTSTSEEYIVEILREIDAENLFLHLILDEDEFVKDSDYSFVKDIARKERKDNTWKIASLTGRNHALGHEIDESIIDKTYEVLTTSVAETQDIRIYVRQLMTSEIRGSDLAPIVFRQEGLIYDSDPILFASLRVNNQTRLIEKFELNNKCYCLFDSSENIVINPIFKKIKIKNTLSQVISDNNLKQGYVTDKSTYEDLSFFFHGEKRKCLKNMITICLNDNISDRKKSYTNDIIVDINKLINNGYHFIACTFSALDKAAKIGNSGDIINAVTEIDNAIDKLYHMCLKTEYTLIICSIYGNVEKFYDVDNEVILRDRTKNLTPFIICEGENRYKDYMTGRTFSLQDVSSTILYYMGMEIPKEMTGSNLLCNESMINIKKNADESKKPEDTKELLLDLKF